MPPRPRHEPGEQVRERAPAFRLLPSRGVKVARDDLSTKGTGRVSAPAGCMSRKSSFGLLVPPPKPTFLKGRASDRVASIPNDIDLLESPQGVEQCFGLVDVRCPKALGEPRRHGHEQVASVGRFALVAPEPGETGGGS